jgi:hypothetical protein
MLGTLGTKMRTVAADSQRLNSAVAVVFNRLREAGIEQIRLRVSPDAARVEKTGGLAWRCHDWNPALDRRPGPRSSVS